MTYDKVDFLLNECGDIKIENGDVVRVTGADLIKQLWLIRIRTFLGEWVGDALKGVPYTDEIFVKNPSKARMTEIFAKITRETPGVLSVESVVISEIDTLTRSVEVTVNATIDGPENFTFYFDGSLGPDSCSGTSSADFPLTMEGLVVWFDAQDLSELTYAPPNLTLNNKAGTGQASGQATLEGVSGIGNKRAVLFDSDSGEVMSIIDTPAVRPSPAQMTIITVVKPGERASYNGQENLGIVALNGIDVSGNQEYYVFSLRRDGDVADSTRLIMRSSEVGAELLTDGDMESATVDDWTASTYGSVSKSLVSPYEGLQSLEAGNDWIIANMTSAKSGTQSIVTRGPASTGFWIDWGDGSLPEWVAHLGTSTDVTTNHSYASVGPWNQKWIGDLSQITYVDIRSQDYSFDLSSISGLTSLTYFYCYNCPLIEGNLSSISGLTSLTKFNCGGCPLIEGNLSSISGLTSLTYFQCHNCPLIEGNLSSISGLTSLTNFRCNGCELLTYTTTTLPQWNNTVLRFDSCGLSTAEVDALIFDLYSSPIKTGGSVNLAGSNDPRTTGAPNDTIYIPALAAAGCPVTSNP